MRTTSPAARGAHRAAAIAITVGLAATTLGTEAGGAPSDDSGATPQRATYQTVLGAYVPSLSKEYGFRSGRLRGGRLPNVSAAFPTAQVQVKDIDGSWRRDSVRFMDAAGTPGTTEAIAIVSANAGGVAWPNHVFVFDPLGRPALIWNSAVAGEAREGTSFGAMTRAGLQLKVSNIVQPDEASCCGTADALFLLAKGGGGRPVVRTVGSYTERPTAAAAWRAVYARDTKAMARLLTPAARRQAGSDPRIARLRGSTRLSTTLTCRVNAEGTASGQRACDAQRGAVRLVLTKTGFARWKVSGITGLRP